MTEEEFYGLANRVGLTFKQAEQIKGISDAMAAAAVLAERDAIAQRVAEMVARWDGPYQRAGDLIVEAIRKGG